MQTCNCGKELKTEGDLKYGICIRCRAKGIKFGFVSTEYGQKGWNNSTVKETENLYKNMPGVEKVSARKELI